MAIKHHKDYLPPHWFLDGQVKRCSVCRYPFPPDVRSIDAAFAEHLGKAHKPAKRKLRIVRDDPLLGVCEYCNVQFFSIAEHGVAKDDIEQQFNAHKCKLQDFAQNAARIVREATKD